MPVSLWVSQVDARSGEMTEHELGFHMSHLSPPGSLSAARSATSRGASWKSGLRPLTGFLLTGMVVIRYTLGPSLGWDASENDPDLGFSQGDRPDSRFHVILS